MSYTQVFGGTTIYPSDVSLLALALDADKALQWPLESNDPTNPAARIIDVTTTGSYAVTLPDATQTGAGQTILFNNLTASSNSFTVKDAGGSTIATVGVGEQWQVYLSGTATAAGTWRVFRYGASTATVQASALAGYGLTVAANTLSQSMAVTTFNSGPRTVLLTDRASALVWNGTGAGVLNLPAAASAANNFFIGVRNGGGGDLTVAASGSETIDGGATLTLSPGDSANVLTDGIRWYTLGLGQDAVFAFDYTSIPVTGGTYTLAGSELNRIAYKFQGALTADQYIVVPATIQQYWVDNATTGAFSLFLRTSGGTPVPVVQGGRGIYYCNGANVVDADTATISLPVSATDGGTGNTSYTVGDLLYANTPTSLAKLSDVAVGNALISGGVGSAPLWGKIGLTTHVSGTLPVANGGTGATTSTGSGAVVLDTSPTLVTPNLGTPSAATLTNATGLPIVAGTTGTLSVARGGTGATTSTGSGAVVLATSPTLVTPVLGAASATSISNGLGAVGTPSYTFTGDTNTGMWSPAADTLAFSEGGVEAMRIDSSGNVLIGTTTNKNRLTVTAGANANAPVLGSAGGIAYFTNTDVTYGLNIGTNAADGHVWLQAQRTDANVVAFNLTLNEAGGNVGIGTSAPSFRLDVHNSAANTVRSYCTDATGTSYAALSAGTASGVNSVVYSFSGAGWYGTTTNHPVVFLTNNTEKMRIDSSGNVGIGTGASVKRLTVVSTIYPVGEFFSAVTATPASVDAGEVFTFSGNSAISGVTFSGADPRLLAFGVTPANNVYVRANEMELIASGAIRLSPNTTERMRIDSSGNVGIGTSTFGTSAATVIGIANGTAPTTSPAGMGQLYVEGGALKYRGSSGTVTTIANA